jgi:hypothetical protein
MAEVWPRAVGRFVLTGRVQRSGGAVRECRFEAAKTKSALIVHVRVIGW